MRHITLVVVTVFVLLLGIMPQTAIAQDQSRARSSATELRIQVVVVPTILNQQHSTANTDGDVSYSIEVKPVRMSVSQATREMEISEGQHRREEVLVITIVAE